MVIRYITSDMDCADCLCRICARNEDNDSFNELITSLDMPCHCDCSIGDILTEECEFFLPDEG